MRNIWFISFTPINTRYTSNRLDGKSKGKAMLNAKKAYWFCKSYSLFPTWYSAFLFTYNNCCLLSSTCSRPHRPIIRRSKLHKQPMVFSPSADVFVVRPYDKDICRGGKYHRLLVQFRPPDDGAVRPETCRGKKTTVIVRKQKSSVSNLETC